ncbi:MAG: tRNA uridine-5-carboxymethylaminomethyl(34) synthesis GTPase MnmE [Paludibacteraceae bacterium]|nr:tRNA uridine-5-carboxymethylaminomethyl(34) synthesis GTPase MnmE [Paludibacteraceae bacterium]
MTDTICAISTPAGTGGIAVIRVSGSDALSIVDKVFYGSHKITEAKGNTILFGELRDDKSMPQSEPVDEVLCSVFRAPHSFTGENTVEISCHGSLYIQQAIVRLLLRHGARAATAGEFTKRAFLNGKLDLSQAEAVADLISASSSAEQRLAIAHLKGGVSQQIQQLRERLLTFTSLIELELDFADHEDISFADRSELNSLAEEIDRHLTLLLDSFRLGNAIKNGIPVAIIGPTNAGKSTLLNALSGEDKAIVSAIPGTTRDAIEDTININGVQFRFIDTAGLRTTSDDIENIGIQRALSAARKAELVIYLQDITMPEEPLPPLPEGKRVLKVYNKTDLTTERRKGLCISAANGDITGLKDAIYSAAELQTGVQDGAVISSARHYDALLRAQQAIKKVKDGLSAQLSGEILSLDLHDCLNALGEITGEITNAEVLQNIFSRFCIGK